MEKNMAEEKFLIENYGKKGTFASFLPGISGEKGIPIWCYYVNRGSAWSVSESTIKIIRSWNFIRRIRRTRM